MANVIKYSTTQPQKDGLRVGNLVVGTGDENYGPTATTGYVNGVPIPNRGYVVYILSSANSPAAYIAYDDNDLVKIAKTLGAGNVNASGAKEYLCARNNTWILDNIPSNIVTDGLVLNLQSRDLSSYPGSGVQWMDISGENNHGEMINGIEFDQNGYMNFDGADDYVWVNYDAASMDGWATAQTIIAWTWHTFTSGRRNIWNQAYGGYGTWTHESGNNINNYFGNSGQNAQPYVSGNSSTTPRGRWLMLCTTRDTSTQKWYQNGVLMNSRSNPYGTLTRTTAGVSIGTGYTGTRWAGRMSTIQAYNKALTQGEILQNYYQGPIVTDGLIYAIGAGNLGSFDPSEEAVYDLSQNQEEVGVNQNGIVYDPSNGGSWVFDGTDDYTTLPSSIESSLNGRGEASLNMWVRLNSNSNGVGDTGIIQLSGYNSSNGNLYWYSNGYTYLDIFRTSRVETVWSNNIIDPRNWHMLTITTTPGTNGWKAYLNGILRKQTTGQSTVSVNSSIQGGLTLGRNNTSRFTYGNIASCFIYDKALTPDEVTQNYNAQSSRFGIN